MGKIYRTRLFRRMFASILTVALLNFIALYVVIFLRSRSFIDARELELATSYRQQVSQRLLEWLDEQRESIVQLAANLAIDIDGGLGDSLFDRRLEACRDSQKSFGDVFSADSEGRMTHLSSAARTPRITVADRDYFLASMAGQVFASGFFRERIHGSLSLAVSAPIVTAAAGRPVGVAVGLLRFDEVEAVVGGLSALKGLGSVTVLDAESRRLVDTAATGASAAPLGSFAAVELEARRAGAAKYRDEAGESVYGSFAWLEGLGLGLVVELSAGRARASMDEVLKFVSLFAALIVIGLAIDVWVLSLGLLKPIGRLSGAVNMLANNLYPDPLLFRTGTELDGIGSCFDHMTQAVRAREAELKDSAARDSLTGLYNHAMIEERLVLELSARWMGEHERPALVIIDLDHFKDVNDRYGHDMGDDVLRAVARILEKASRDDDFIGRYGGEEFAVILRGRSGGEVARYCERLRAAIAAEAFPCPGAGAEARSFSVTASFGWALCPPGAATPSDLFRRADAGLYAAKAEGRDRVREGSAPSLQKPADRG